MGHYASLRVTTGHYGSLPVTTGHYGSLRVTTGHYGSLRVTTGHYGSLRVTTGHYGSLRVTTGHCGSLRVTTHYYGVTTSHCGSAVLPLDGSISCRSQWPKALAAFVVCTFEVDVNPSQSICFGLLSSVLGNRRAWDCFGAGHQLR